MAVLDFGLRRIIKNGIVASIIWIVILFVIALFKANNLTNLLDENIQFLLRPIVYLFSILYILSLHFFAKNFVRIEVMDSKILLTGLQFFRFQTKEISIDDLTYKIMTYTGYHNNFKEITIYEKYIESYHINDKDLNEEEFDQVVSFFRVYLPISAKLK
jgi:hypothetical protein